MTATSAHPEHTNALAGETSPYLLQHAHNPVEWYPWGEEALERARREDKPILLSIGYSACHWCHVMAHESFEDPEVARLMNERFINIKVDREERPDLDKIYQLAHQLLTQRPGGWPLTMFLTSTQIPFFGGTYFPKEPRWGMPGLMDVLTRVSDFYHQRQDAISEQNQAVLQALGQLEDVPRDADTALDPVPLDLARQQLERSYDTQYGGFGNAPKFPHPTGLERLLRHWASSAQHGQPDARAAEMALHTLRAMDRGGIYDHLGGGFCRYSVDDQWMIPHFEKMLYDNGPLLALNAQAWQATGDELFRRVAEETGEWLMREMQSPEGGYYSSLDADSEGEEGKFYTWTREEVQRLLTDEEYAVFAAHFGLEGAPNFEGKWHLHVAMDIDSLAEHAEASPEEVRALIDTARAKLFAARAERAYPGRDEKVLTAWNGLAIKGMAAAGRILGRADFIDSAARALDFVRAHLRQADGRLYATYKDGVAHLNAYLDDYAFMADAALELLQARWRADDLRFATELLDTLQRLFEDTEGGGFYFTSSDHEALIQRPKPVLDESTPAGNGVAAQMFGRLGHLLGDPGYLDAAERTLRATIGSVQRAPHAHNGLLTALEEHLYPPQTIVVRGEPQAISAWHARCQRGYAPRRMTLTIPAEAPDLPGVLAERKPQGEAVAYVCSGMQCGPPITDLEALDEALKNHQASAASAE